MNSFLIGNITGAIYLDTRRPKIMDGEAYYPVKARITHERKRYYIALGFDLTEEDFNRLPTTKRKDLTTTKKLITASFERVKKEVEAIHKVDEYSHEKLRKRLQRGRNEFVEDTFNSIIKELTAEGRAGTAASYESAKNFILKYDSGLRFANVTVNWLKAFEAWALNKEGIRVTTLGIYLRSLRVAVNRAVADGNIKREAYPFGESNKGLYEIPQGTGTKIALTIEQMNSIARLELAGSLERCRDIFLLSFHLGGINIKDLLLLRWQNIKGDEVHFIREKTKRTAKKQKTITIPYNKKAMQIIERWSNDDKNPEAYIIPFLTDGLTPEKLRDNVKSYIKQMNKQLKRIGEMVGIDGLTTYVARHSFATILKNSGAPVAFIGEVLGHTSTKTTEGYLKSFEKEQKQKHFDVIANVG